MLTMLILVGEDGGLEAKWIFKMSNKLIEKVGRVYRKAIKQTDVCPYSGYSTGLL